MCRSAMASSSPVETPGRSSDSTSAGTSATIGPARRIFAISAGDLTVTCRERASATSGRRSDAGHDVGDRLGHLLDVAPPVDGRQDAALAVVGHHLGERTELLGEPGPDRLRAVVVALVERGPVDVADAAHPGRVADLVTDVPGRPPLPAAG